MKIAAFDHTYYIDIRLNESNIKFKNNDQIDYSWNLIEDESINHITLQMGYDCCKNDSNLIHSND